jgi:amidase
VYFDDATALAAAIRTKELSAREVLQAHLDRIAEVNPGVNAIVTLVADAAQEAAARADDRIAAGEQVGPLHGLPIAHKDLVPTKGIRTTYGSPLFADNVPDFDASIVERLRAAGAITIGKTNTPEFGLGSHTFNPVFGTTRNPYDLGKSAGGSSGGAAAALATGMIPIADGSDTGGSLRNPASFCNVVGFRPTPGRVPCWPDSAPFSTLSTHGPMARTVSDVALLLSAIAGPDPRSPLSFSEPASIFAGTLESETAGMRVAWTPDFGGLLPVEPAVIDALRPQLTHFESIGATVELACPDLADADHVFRILRAFNLEMARGELLDAHRDRLKPDAVWNIEEGRKLTGPDVGRAEKLHAGIHQTMVEFFDHYDVLLAPVNQVVPFDVDLVHPTVIAGVEMPDYLAWMGACYLVSVTGCPAISVPAGFTPDGLPVGLQLIGPHRQDRRLLEIAYGFEQACGAGRQRPAAIGI